MLSHPGQSVRHVPTKKSPRASCPHRLALLSEATLAGPQHRRSDAPSGSLRAARLKSERLMSALHAVLSQGAKQAPPDFLAWPETFGGTNSKWRRRSREMNDFQSPLAQTPRTLFRDHHWISELRPHWSSFDADLRLEIEDHARLEDSVFGNFLKSRANAR